MLKIFVFLFKLIISFFLSDKNIIIQNLLLQKENQILKRKIKLQRIRVDRFDKLIFVFLNLIEFIGENYIFKNLSGLKLFLGFLWEFLCSEPFLEPLVVGRQ